MTNAQVKELKSHFLTWSGGFPPESEFQVIVYIDYALHRGIDEVQAKRFLLKWMNRPDAMDGWKPFGRDLRSY